MKFFDVIGFAFANIAAQKLRTFLTTLAIAVGGFLIFLLPSLGLGFARVVQDQFESQQSLTGITVQPKYEEFKVDFSNPNPEPPEMTRRITMEDVASMRNVEGVKGVRSADMYISPTKVRFDSVNKEVQTSASLNFASNKDFQSALQISVLPTDFGASTYNYDLVAGTFLNEVRDEAFPVVVNEKALEAAGITDANQALGTTVTFTFSRLDSQAGENPASEIKTYTGTIRGVVKSKPSDSEFAVFNPNSPIVAVPLHSAWEVTKWSNGGDPDFEKNFTVYSVMLEATTPEVVEATAQRLKEQGFEVRSVADEVESFQKAIRVMILVLSSFGLIALFVGALNIVNTMMMAVTERTKEIGILRSQGVSQSMVRAIFLTESAVLALFGAFVGVFLGWIVSLIANALLYQQLKNIFGGSNAPDLGSFFDYSPELIFGVLGFITLIGILAGIAPAIRASRLNVVDSLRYE